ncbi:MAG: transposase [Ferruginibacter sp.]|nr:transposase [Ferruginibacter sp.]
MSVKYKHDDSYSMYFCTFTCFNWLPLIEDTKSYDQVYQWFNVLKSKNISVVAYVIMPNHLHCILYFPEPGFDLNKIISNAKRFMAYEIINRLEENKETVLLELLSASVSEREKKKGQLHKVFKDSFDAKPIFSDKFLTQKIDYIHHNPVSGKWNLAKDFVSYEHSSAAFYELGVAQHFLPVHYRDL